MRTDVLMTADAVAQSAKFIALQAAAAIGARGWFMFAVSGSHTPWLVMADAAAAGIDSYKGAQ